MKDNHSTNIPSDDVQKVFFNIGEVAAMLNVNESTIRYWQKEFKQLNPHVTSSGQRKFNHDDISVLREIYSLLKVKKLTIEGAKNHLSMAKQNQRQKKAIDALVQLKQFLQTLKEQL